MTLCQLGGKVDADQISSFAPTGDAIMRDTTRKEQRVGIMDFFMRFSYFY